MVASPILHCSAPFRSFFFTLRMNMEEKMEKNSVHLSMCSTTDLRTTSSVLSDSALSRKKTCCSPSTSVYTTSFPHSRIRAAYSLFRSRPEDVPPGAATMNTGGTATSAQRRRRRLDRVVPGRALRQHEAEVPVSSAVRNASGGHSSSERVGTNSASLK
jgi:hypothetical protein